MKPFIKVITLAVEDLEQSLAFYRDGMGLETEGIFGTEFEHGAVVFFHLRSGLILALWPKESLSVEANIPLSEIHSAESPWRTMSVPKRKSTTSWPRQHGPEQPSPTRPATASSVATPAISGIRTVISGKSSGTPDGT